MSTRNKMKVNVQSGAESPSTSSGLPANLLQYLNNKFSEQHAAFKQLIKESEDKVMQKFSSIEAEIINLRGELKSINVKIDKTNKRCDALDFDLNQMKSTISALENITVASDIIISNVPNNITNNITDDAFKKIVRVLQGEKFFALNAFRTRSSSNNNNKSTPIIVKLQSPAERIRLFRALAVHRKSLKRQHKLSDFGFIGDDNLQVHECLSALNRDIMRNALHCKRSKLLNSVLTMRGYVFVRMRPNDVAIKITTTDALNKIIDPINNNFNSPPNVNK